MIFQTNVNGFSLEATFNEEDVISIFKPLLKKIIDLKKDERVIVFIGAPPALGKSTLVQFLEHLAKTELGCHDIQGIGIDGFHFYNDYLIEKDLKKEKGSIKTFHVEKLEKYLIELKEKKNLMWPIYDRNLHNPVEKGIMVNKSIILLEGNYLCHKKWEHLKKYSDYSIFISSKAEFLKKRLVDRKIRGGLTLEEATAFYENSDGINIKDVLENQIEVDVKLEFDGNKYKICKGGF